MRTLAVVIVLCAPAVGLAQTVRVNIQSVPPGASVFVDSRDAQSLGTTPLSKVAVPRGRRSLIYVLEGFEDASLSVDVQRQRETFVATLTPLATLELAPDAQSAGADVMIDGQTVGTLPFNGKVRRGR